MTRRRVALAPAVAALLVAAPAATAQIPVPVIGGTLPIPIPIPVLAPGGSPAPPPAPGPAPAPSPGQETPGATAGGRGAPYLSPTPPLCAPVRARTLLRRGGTVSLDTRQLLINQRISQAAVRRVAAVERWLDEGVEARDICGGSLTERVFGPGVRLARTATAVPLVRADPRPVRPAPAPRASTARVRLSPRQFLINQRVSQAALRRANALLERFESGLTGGDVRPGQIGPGQMVRGLTVSRVRPVAEVAASRVAPGPAPEGRAATARVEVSLRQLGINQRIAQTAVRRANLLSDRLASGLTAQDFRAGSIGPDDLSPALVPAGS